VERVELLEEKLAKGEREDRNTGHRYGRQGNRIEAGRARSRGAHGLTCCRERERARLGRRSGRGCQHGYVRGRRRVRRGRVQLHSGGRFARCPERGWRDQPSREWLIDVANPLDFSQGMPPSLSVCNTDSLGERIHRAFPATRVVKALNTGNCDVMVEPARVPGEHVVFVCGNDPKLSARRPACLASSAGLPSVCSPR
jgi:hypothetical protein